MSASKTKLTVEWTGDDLATLRRGGRIVGMYGIDCFYRCLEVHQSWRSTLVPAIRFSGFTKALLPLLDLAEKLGADHSKWFVEEEEAFPASIGGPITVVIVCGSRVQRALEEAKRRKFRNAAETERRHRTLPRAAIPAWHAGLSASRGRSELKP